MDESGPDPCLGSSGSISCAADRTAGRPEPPEGSCARWSRRRFLEPASSLPVVGGIAAAGTGAAEAASKGSADYFRDLGVRPFINAAGTYTAMTASLMPQEVLDAIQYAAQRFVM